MIRLTPMRYPKFKGWGHSTWQEALKIAEAANVKNTFLFHHDPSHNDDRMDQIAAEAASLIQTNCSEDEILCDFSCSRLFPVWIGGKT